MVVVSHRSMPEGWGPEAPFHFVDGVEAAVAKAQELAGDRMVEVAAGDVGGQVLAAHLDHEMPCCHTPDGPAPNLSHEAAITAFRGAETRYATPVGTGVAYTLTSEDVAVGVVPGRFLCGTVDAATALDSAFAWVLTPTPLPGDNYGLPKRP